MVKAVMRKGEPMDKAKAINYLMLAVPIKALIKDLTDKEHDEFHEALEMAIDGLKAQGTTFALNNQVNLCDSCTYTYPECPSEKDDVIFGNGIGNDNICACNKYQPTVQPVATDINVGDTISRQQAIDAINHICPVDTEYDCTLLDRVDVRCVLSDLPSVQPNLQPTCNQLATDTISRQAAIDALRTCYDTEAISMDNGDEYINYGDAVGGIEQLPSAQPEPSISLSWIEKHIELLKSFDNEFANLAAADISVMVMKWRREQHEND